MKRDKKGVMKPNSGSFKKGHPATNTSFKKGHTPWNIGLTKETDERVAENGRKTGEGRRRKGCIPWNIGKTKEEFPQLAGSGRKKGCVPWNKNKKCPYLLGNKYRLGKTPWNKNKSFMPKEFYQRIGLLGLKKQAAMKEPTSIEKKVYEELKARGILFETQKLINGRFLVDAYIPSLNLVVEADGSYWHSLPKTIKKDKIKNAYLKACGFSLLRLTETEINNGSFKEKLSEEVN